MDKLTSILKSTILKYGASSGISFLVDYGLFTLLYWMGLSIMVSTYAARGCSCIVNFILNRNGVFRSGGDPAKQFILYILLVILSATVSGLAVTALSSRLPLPVIGIKFGVEAILFFMNYLIQKKLIFPKKNNP